ncbi:MAG: hypothetical protein LBK75_00995 [Oscillospiraceae bacterium]|jgi:hypothetical protein|nr:hypothetical protein [Oscillospiraceae bacterium]
MKELLQRKPTRLKSYDYNRNGAYFVTICVKDRAELLCTIEPAQDTDPHTTVLVGGGVLDAPPRVPDAPRCKLTPYGDIVAKKIENFEKLETNYKETVQCENNSDDISTWRYLGEWYCAYSHL